MDSSRKVVSRNLDASSDVGLAWLETGCPGFREASTFDLFAAGWQFGQEAIVVPMLLWCPNGHRHIDKGRFAEKGHENHACQTCGIVWRPALVDTIGVQFLPGFKDEPVELPPPPPPPDRQRFT